MLIIGILAAIAVPQYQRTVWKSRAAELIPFFRSYTSAQERYFLQSGQWGTLDQLDISFDLPIIYPNEESLVYTYTHAGNNKFKIAVVDQKRGQPVRFWILFPSGPYQSTGFGYLSPDAAGNGLPVGKILCFETAYKGADRTTPQEVGRFCKKVMGISSPPISYGGGRYWVM